MTTEEKIKEQLDDSIPFILEEYGGLLEHMDETELDDMDHGYLLSETDKIYTLYHLLPEGEYKVPDDIWRLRSLVDSYYNG